MNDLLAASRPALRERMRAGFHVEHATLADSAWLGVSLGMPAWVDRLAWKTFVKTFAREDGGDSLRGWNVRLEQTGIDGPVRPLLRRGRPIHFGHYRVRELVPRGATADLPRGVLLDYGAGDNFVADPTRLLRDPVAALDEAGTVLLGWTYLALGGGVGTPSWFVLRRLGSLAEVEWAAPAATGRGPTGRPPG